MSPAAESLNSDPVGLPRGWTRTTLGELGLKTRPKLQADRASDLPFIGMDDIAPGALAPSGHGRFGDMKSAAAAFEPGDVIYGRLRPYLNKVWAADFTGAASAEFIVIQRSEAIEPRLLAYLLHSRAFVNFASARAAGDRPRVDIDDVRAFEFNLPPRDDQPGLVRRIDALFEQIGEGEAELKQARKLFDVYLQTVLRAAVTGDLTADWRRANAPKETGADLLALILAGRREAWLARGKDVHKFNEQQPPDVTELPTLPPSWVWASIGQLFSVAVGSTPSRAKPELWQAEIPWVSSGEVAFNRIKTTGEAISRNAVSNPSTRIHPPGTVMIAMIGEGKTRGQCAILDIAAAHNQNCASIRVSETPVPPEYVFAVLRSRYEKTRADGQGGNQPAMNSEMVKAIELPLPPAVEISEIVARVETAQSYADQMARELDQAIGWAASLRESVLNAAFNGRLQTARSLGPVRAAENCDA